ncbi:MAG: aminoglycoside phosphotransferase family protein [Lachnospiraceae bacterium]|nr:aminoglycoside phosphotransferase family protein [Lachnospiraceae bacterium]
MDQNLEKYIPSEACLQLLKLTEKIPDSHTLLHADYHLKNILISDDELMLIDMDTLCAGDPIFELATIYNSYMEFPSISPEAAFFSESTRKRQTGFGRKHLNYI